MTKETLIDISVLMMVSSCGFSRLDHLFTSQLSRPNGESFDWTIKQDAAKLTGGSFGRNGVRGRAILAVDGNPPGVLHFLEETWPMQTRVVRTFDAVAEFADTCHKRGETIAFVPTMGALHAGHLSLVARGKELAHRLIVTIFVNPRQFGPNEDLNKYPRTLIDDLRHLESYDVDCVFAPDENEVYPEGFSTLVEPPDVAKKLEGLFRPTHFRGVTTVVLKLLNGTRADIAVFGQKDFQQVAVVRAMLKDLNHSCRIEVVDTARDDDGLALSSRNRFLSQSEREQARGLYKTLKETRREIFNGSLKAGDIEAFMTKRLNGFGIESVEYAVAVDPETLETKQDLKLPIVLLIAAFVGQTRLIDNELIQK
jgi:pantoate--beta-alanine ligase